MRQIKCKNCGKTFEATEYQVVCPECKPVIRRGVAIRQRTCQMCGASFVGYPRSKYCPNCKTEAKREAWRKYQQNGAQRKLGSEDVCEACGKPYIVNAGQQRYCKECAEKVVLEHLRAHNREYQKEYTEKNGKTKREKICVICGKPFLSNLPDVTCSEECDRERLRRIQAKADAKRRTENEKEPPK